MHFRRFSFAIFSLRIDNLMPAYPMPTKTGHKKKIFIIDNGTSTICEGYLSHFASLIIVIF